MIQLKIAILASAGTVGWWIGGRLSTDAAAMALGVILGAMVGIPIALIAMTGNRSVRVDHYHTHTHRTLAEPHSEPQRAIEAQPVRYIVVGETKRLQAANRPQIEVKR